MTRARAIEIVSRETEHRSAPRAGIAHTAPPRFARAAWLCRRSRARDWADFASEGGDPVDANAPHALKEQFFEVLRVLRVAWVIPVLAFFALAVPPQVRDLYRALAEKKDWPQIVVTVLLLMLAAYLTYRVGRHRALVHRHVASGKGSLLGGCLSWGPALCGGLLLAAAAVGVYWTTSELPAPKGIDDGIDKTLGQIA